MWTKGVACALALAVSATGWADARKDLLDALREAERRLELSRQSVPPSFDAEGEKRVLSGMAGRLGVTVELMALPEAGKLGRLALHRLEVTGPDTGSNLRDLLYILARRELRAGDLETLHADGRRFTARLLLPVYAGGEPGSDPGRELELIRATQGAIDRLNWSRARDASALLEAAQVDNVRLTAVRVDEDVTIEGVLAGSAARKKLLAKIGEAGLSVRRLQLSPSGACRSFALTAGRVEGRTETTLDLAPSPLCREDTGPAAEPIAVRGSKADGLTMRLRGIDLADVFFVLHDLTGESFVVDPDVQGVVDVNVDHATVDEVLAAIRRSGVVIGNTPLRRVSRAGAPEPQSTDYAGDPVSILLGDADLRSILCLYESITGLKFDLAPDLRIRASLWVRDRPWDEILDALLAGARLRYRIVGERVLVGEKATSSVCQPPSPSSFSDTAVQLPELGAADLTLAGISGSKAYAYGAWRRPLVLEKGARVFDGVVQSVGPDGVRFAMDGGMTFDLPLR